MLYDFDLKPENEKRIFSDKTLEKMQEYLNNFPLYKVREGFYYIFEDDSQKEAGIQDILSDIAQNRNIYIYPSIEFTSTSIVVSVFGDNDVDCHLYDFVVWCQERYPCKLYYASELVTPEDLLSEEEEIPLID